MTIAKHSQHLDKLTDEMCRTGCRRPARHQQNEDATDFEVFVHEAAPTPSGRSLRPKSRAPMAVTDLFCVQLRPVSP